VEISFHWDPASSSSSLATRNLHVHLILNDLEQLPRLRYSASLNLGPHRHVIQCNLKGPRADKLSLNSVEEEESHHASVDLVVEEPLSPARGGLAHTGKWVKAGQDHHDDEEFDDTENLGGLEAEAAGGEIISTDGKVRVFLLQYTGILLKYLLVSSGVTVQEFDGWTHHLGHLGGWNILLGSSF